MERSTSFSSFAATSRRASKAASRLRWLAKAGNHDYARTAATATGLRVRAHLVRRRYHKGVRITDLQMRQLAITKDDALPKWNYTIGPA